MSWHASGDGTKDDGKIRHSFDGKQWKDFNTMFEEFDKEAQNIRFTLSTDRMNPLSDLSSSHNTWPVIMTIYNTSFDMSEAQVPSTDHAYFRTKAARQ
jgi:hypothetical protein